MSSSRRGAPLSPAALAATLQEVQAALHRRASPATWSLRTERREAPQQDEDVSEAFGACQTIEWKEQEFLYLRSRVDGLGRREVDGAAHPAGRVGGGAALPPVHRTLLRSVSTPDAPSLEGRGHSSLQRARRPSLTLGERGADACGCGGWAGEAARACERRALHEASSQVQAKIVSYVKSAAWASRESLLSAASFSMDSSEEEGEGEGGEGSVVQGGPARSVSEETLTYSLEPPAGPAESEAPHRPASPASPAARHSFSFILDSIPHIDSSDDEGEAGEGEEKEEKEDEEEKEQKSEAPQQEEEAASGHVFQPDLPPLCQPEEDLCGETGDAAPRRQPPDSCPQDDVSCASHTQNHTHHPHASTQTPAHTHTTSHTRSSSLPPNHTHTHTNARSSKRRYSHTILRHISRPESHTSGQTPTYSSSSSSSSSSSTSASTSSSYSSSSSSSSPRDASPGKARRAAALTGGVTKGGVGLVEVWDSTHPHLATALAACLSPALPRSLLLLLPAEGLRASHLIHVMKERVWAELRTWAELRVWVVAATPTTAHHARKTLHRARLKAEVVTVTQLQERVSRDQVTSRYGGTLKPDLPRPPRCCPPLLQLRERLVEELRPWVTSLASSILTHAPPTSSSSSSTSSSSSFSPAPHSLAPPDLAGLRSSVASAKRVLREMQDLCQTHPSTPAARGCVEECERLVAAAAAVLETATPSRHSRLLQEADAVVAWLLGRGEETLAHHQTLADTLTGITRQQADFLRFSSVAMRHLEKGGSLLQEAASAGETEASVRELAGALHLHLTQFTERLHHTRDRLEDTARCYHLLDKAYEWALAAMKVVGRVKGEGLASPEQVGAAARTLTAHLEEHPPIPEDTFTTMTTLAARLNNHTLLQQCKMAQVRCQETSDLLRRRQAALQKAKRQMEFDCQSFVDLGEVFGGGEEVSPLAWLPCSPLNASGRRRSSLGSRPREPLSRCPSVETDDDSVFLDPPPPTTPSKAPLEPRTSLGDIKEVRESAEDLQQSSASPRQLGSPSTVPSTSLSGSSGNSSSSSCSSSDSSGPVTTTAKFMKRANTWQYGLMAKTPTEENNGLEEGSVSLSPVNGKNFPPSAVNSHLLIRGSQLNLSINTDDLSQEEVKKSKTLLLIMRELIQTERDYVNSLEYIIENYIPELMREDIPQALRGQRNVVFGNIEKIYEFHSGYFLRALEAYEMRPFAIGSIFLRYENQFHLYALYNKNKPKSDSLMSEYGSAFFRKKQLELEDKMDLASYLLKPVQRMGKYALILKQLLKECSRGEENYDDLQGAQEMVQFQLRHGNDLLAMDSLRDCDVNLKEQGRLLRQGEFVVWEGSRARKTVRHVFLFEDLILFSKSRRDPEKKTLDIFQYKHSMKMTDIGLTEQVGESPTKFEIWFRKRKPSDTYLLQAPNTEVKEAWTEEISKLLWRQALRNRTMRLHEMSSMGIGNKPCLDIRPSEDQINDRSISINQLNKVPRLRTGSVCVMGDVSGGIGKRPHSVISVSSSSASSSASSASSSHSSTVCPTYVGALNLGFEPGDSPRALHRSVTRTSQCSAESGILADMYPGGDEDAQSHRRVERSNSTITTLSVDSALSPVTSTCPTSPTSSSSSPTSPTTPSSTSPTTCPITKPPESIPEVPCVSPPTKDAAAKTLLTTEV